MSAESAFVLRLVVALLVWTGLGLLVFAVRRRLPLGPRLCMDFSLGLYTLTFYVGSTWLYLRQDQLIDRYFSGFVVPPNISYPLLFALASGPIAFTSCFTLILWRLMDGRAPIANIRKARVSDRSVLNAVWLTLALLAPVAGVALYRLVLEALPNLAGIEGSQELYRLREQAFSGLRAYQAGIIYGTLPACAALYLLLLGRKSMLRKCVGMLLAGLVILVNASLFQFGPILMFGLMCLSGYVAVRLGRLPMLRIAVVGCVLLIALSLYNQVKTGGQSRIAQSFASMTLRMPISLPYAMEMRQESIAVVGTSDALPFDLAEYMFPEFGRSRERFVAMPVPGFVQTWMQNGVLAMIGSLLISSLIVAVFGRWLQRSFDREDGNGALLTAIAASPMLYYMFQISLADLFLSSYSVLYVLLPVIVAHALARFRLGRLNG